MTTEVRSLKVTTIHLSIAYEESGPQNGAPIILLHGFPYSIRQYDKVRDVLLRQTTCRIIVPHLRGFGGTTYLSPSPSPSTTPSGSQAAIAKDLIDLLDALNIPTALLVGYDWGGRAACIVSALWPHRVTGLLSCQGYAIQDIEKNATVAADPELTLRRWYTHYLNTPQGVIGLRERRKEFCKLLWRLWSPNWKFTEEEYDLAADAFENDGFVETVVHSYRHRYGNVGDDDDDEEFQEIERKLRGKPKIGVPTVAVSGGSDGVEVTTEEDGHREFFMGWYEMWVLERVGPLSAC